MSEEADPHAVRMSKLRFSIAAGLRFVEEETGKSRLVTAVFRDIETRAVELEASIASLTAEVQRHRMTEEERVAVNDAAAECDYDNRAMAIHVYLDRTAPPAAS